MKIVCSSRGSRGDVHPVIEISSALARKGHDVFLCVPPLFEKDARARGVVPGHYYSEDSTQVMESLGSGLNAWKAGLKFLSDSVEDQWKFMLEASEGADAMVSTSQEILAPSVAEYRGIPHYRIAYTPVLPGTQPPPLVPWQGSHPLVNRALWTVVNGSAGLFIRDLINAKRKKLGLKSVFAVGPYFTRHSHTLLAINDRLSPPCVTWAGRYRYDYTGYVYGDIHGGLAPEIEEFLAAGPAPVYIGFGSVMVHDADAFTGTALRAISSVGCRALIGSGWTGLGRRELPRGVMCIGDSNHGSLFPRTAGVVHHGGSGTLHTAARAGTPQLIMPQIADQFYWGARVRELGLGPTPLLPKKASVKAFTARLADLLENAEYASNARELGERMKSDNGVEKAVSIITRPAYN